MEFNYKGVIFEAETEADSDSRSLILIAVSHKDQDITECLNDDVILDMEKSLNAENDLERALAIREMKENL